MTHIWKRTTHILLKVTFSVQQSFLFMYKQTQNHKNEDKI